MKKPAAGNPSSGLTLLLVLLTAAVTSCTGSTEPTRPAISAEILAAITTSYSRAITIDYTKVPGTDQKNFPVLVSGTYDGQNERPDLRWTGNGGKVQNANGYDVGFYTSSGCSRGKMKWETELYNAQTGEVAYWVKVPAVSHTQNTVFYLCYGNAGITSNQAQPSAVWDSHYLTVWHLSNKGGGLDLSNSADTKYAFNNSGLVSRDQGKIGGGTSKFIYRDSTFVPADAEHPDHYNYFNHDYLDNRDISIGANGAVTISLWKKVLSQDICGFTCTTPYDGNHMSFVMGVNHEDYYNSMALFAPYFCDLQWFYSKDDASKVNLYQLWCTPSSYSDRWVYITAVYNPAANRLKALYLDGELVGSTTGGGTTNATVKGFHLGEDPTGRGGDPSWFDEVRVSKSSRSPNWIKTEFNNQNDPASFYSFGPEVTH